MAIGMLEDGLVGLTPVQKLPPIGKIANAPHQKALGFMKATTFELGIVEFDDQGRCYDRAQLDKVSDAIEEMRASSKDVIILTFVHGWKHDARSDDANLTSFREILDATAKHEVKCAGDKARSVYGIFAGWRGMSAYGLDDAIANTTFWGRQEAGHRVATGSVRELFGRLRHYRNSRRKHGGSPLLVIAGHSFGGMIVYSALAQSLIEGASAPDGRLITGFADLVLLVNPAIEGERYLPLYDLKLTSAFKQRDQLQLPVFICIQAKNDQPVGTFFPIGNFKNRIEEASIGPLEERCITHALGFIDEFRTHTIDGPIKDEPFVLHPPEIHQTDPYWVIAADKAVIDGHGGIWQPPFLQFLAAVLFQQVNATRALGGNGRGGAAGGTSGRGNGPKDVSPGTLSVTREIQVDGERSALVVRAEAEPPAALAIASGNLADFAQTITDAPGATGRIP